MTTVLYHDHCPDGFGSAFACWQRFGDTAQYVPVQHGQPPPDIPPEHNVWIVDFSYPEDTLKMFLAARIGRRHCNEDVLTVLDHHISAQRDLASLMAQDLPGLRIVFDQHESGASLTWKYLRTGEWAPAVDPDPHGLEDSMPRLFHYLRDRDLWQWQLPDSKAVSLAIWCEPREFPAWQAFTDALETPGGYATLVAKGTALLAYQAQLVDEQARRAIWRVLDGYTVPVVNATMLLSEVGHWLCTTYPDAPFAAYYFDRGGQRQWGLRGHGTIDLSVIATRHGGGGHAAAAGFVTARGWLPEAVPHVPAADPAADRKVHHA